MSTVTAELTKPESFRVGPTRRWSTDEFYRLMDLGFIREGSGAFLWDGEIITPMAKKPPHADAEAALWQILPEHFPRADFTIYGDTPLHLGDGFDPQPDLMILRGSLPARRGLRALPGDVTLLIEVAGTTYAHDSGVYLQAYARAGIPVYWIVNLAARRIEVYSDPIPSEGDYRSRRDFGTGDSVPCREGYFSAGDVLGTSNDVPTP